MASDIQVAYPQQSINISSVAMVQGLDLPTVAVIGDDFSAVDSVLINDIPSPSVVVVSKTQLVAVLPQQVYGQSVLNISVVSYRLVYTAQSVVSFRLGNTNRRATGMIRLVQLFLKVLLTTPGSDIFNPTLGGGAMVNLGRTFSLSNSGSIVSDFVISVDNTVKQIISMQARQPRLPREERLLTARVAQSYFDTAQTALIAAVNLASQAGAVATANLLL
jgi:hypothetical protein